MRSCWLLLGVVLLGSGGVRGSPTVIHRPLHCGDLTPTTVDLKQLEGTWVTEQSVPLLENIPAKERADLEHLTEDLDLSAGICIRSVFSGASTEQADQQLQIFLGNAAPLVPSSTLQGTIRVREDGAIETDVLREQGIPIQRGVVVTAAPERYYVTVTCRVPSEGSEGAEGTPQGVSINSRVPLTPEEAEAVWAEVDTLIPELGLKARKLIKFGQFCHEEEEE